MAQRSYEPTSRLVKQYHVRRQSLKKSSKWFDVELGSIYCVFYRAIQEVGPARSIGTCKPDASQLLVIPQVTLCQ